MPPAVMAIAAVASAAAGVAGVVSQRKSAKKAEAAQRAAQEQQKTDLKNQLAADANAGKETTGADVAFGTGISDALLKRGAKRKQAKTSGQTKVGSSLQTPRIGGL